MVKGTNKQIIEVKNTDNPYFERAILIVRAEKSHVGGSEKQFQAKRYIKSLAPYKNARRGYTLLKYCAIAILGAIVALIIASVIV